MSLIAELHRRNVLRVAALYATVAWLVFQIARDAIVPLELPAWTMAAVIFALAAGFLVAVVLSWSYQLTPQGLRRETGTGDRTIFGALVRRLLDAVIALALLAAAGYFLWTRHA